MADITVGSDIHAFMQSASQEQMRDRIGLQDVVGPQFAARQMAGYGISDGATANRGEILTPGAIGAVAGLPMTSLAVVDVPTSNPSVVAHLAVFSSSATSASHASISLANSLYVVSGTTGILAIRQTGAVGGDYVDFRYANFRADYSGQRVRLEVSFTEGDSTTDPLIYANGVDITSEFARTTGGTVPNWMPTTLATTYVLAGYDWPAGRSPYGRAIIGALSSTESATWGTTGELPTWATKAGSAAPVYSSDFSSTIDAWEPVGVGAIAATGSTLQLTASGGGVAGTRASTARSMGTLGIKIGEKVLMSFEHRYISGSSGSGGATATVQSYDGPAWSIGSSVTFSPVTEWTKRDVEFTLLDTNSGKSRAYFRFGSFEADDVVQFRSISFRPAGLIDDPYYQPALATGDRLGRMSRRLLGITPVPALGQNDFMVIGNTDSSAAGGEQILGGPVINVGTTVIDSIEQVPASGTPTTSVGSATGALTTYVASGALSAGVNPATLATRKVATANLWAKSDGTMVVRTFVKGHQISTPV